MAYDPLTDFLTVNRLTSGGVRLERMPGLDYVVAALARIGLCDVWISPTDAPMINVSTTVWLKTSSTDWAAEGSVFLYDANTDSFQPATPELWQALLSIGGGDVFQSVTGAAAIVLPTTTLLAIQRNNPGVTTLSFPPVAGRTRPLRVVDYSTNVAAHQVINNANGADRIMRVASFSLWSTVDQLAGASFYPSPDLNAWVIAP